MNVQLTITTDDGVVYGGELKLRAVNPPKAKGKARIAAEHEEIDLDLPIRHFMKKYSKSMSGPKRLTLLVARLAKGDLQTQVERAKASKQWNKMRALMGGPFNSAYETRARDNGWLNSPKPGVYTLLPNWREVL